MQRHSFRKIFLRASSDGKPTRTSNAFNFSGGKWCAAHRRRPGRTYVHTYVHLRRCQRRFGGRPATCIYVCVAGCACNLAAELKRCDTTKTAVYPCEYICQVRAARVLDFRYMLERGSDSYCLEVEAVARLCKF